VTEGEEWAQSVLGELRAAGYRPGAWGRFFAVSFGRARERRHERPREHRIVLVLGVLGLAAWAGATGRPGLALAGAAWWAAAMLMLDWHLGMLERTDGTPVDGIGLANLLTFLRAGLPPALFALIGTDVGLALFAVAGASDVADGLIARRRNEVTRLGAWLDPAVDALVLSAAALGAARVDLLAGSVAALVVSRYALPWLVVGTHYFTQAAPPERRGLVPGRVPGLVLYAGLALALLRLPGATTLVLVGSAGGLATFAASLVQGLRLRPARGTLRR
jgi:phosphatidylglycerophosphate synthase